MTKTPSVLIGAIFLLSGCGFASDAVWPSLTGDAPDESPQAATEQAENTVSTAQTTTPAMTSDFGGGPTGTFVGERVAQLQSELSNLQTRVQSHRAQFQQIRQAVAGNAERYHGTIATIRSRLQVGTTKGNPVLVSQWNAAQSQLDRINSDITALNSLANTISGEAGMASFLLESGRASFGISGAVEEDHRRLEALVDETSQTIISINSLRDDVAEAINRQTAFVSAERTNLTQLSAAIERGGYDGTAVAARDGADYVAASRFSMDGRRPLVVIRFDRPNVAYEQPLYSALSKALERRPESEFDVVAVTPQGTSAAEIRSTQQQARRNAESVTRSMTEMGLPAERVRLSSTMSEQVATNEVHIFVR